MHLKAIRDHPYLMTPQALRMGGRCVEMLFFEREVLGPLFDKTVQKWKIVVKSFMCDP